MQLYVSWTYTVSLQNVNRNLKHTNFSQARLSYPVTFMHFLPFFAQKVFSDILQEFSISKKTPSSHKNKRTELVPIFQKNCWKRTLWKLSKLRKIFLPFCKRSAAWKIWIVFTEKFPQVPVYRLRLGNKTQNKRNQWAFFLENVVVYFL